MGKTLFANIREVWTRLDGTMEKFLLQKRVLIIAQFIVIQLHQLTTPVTSSKVVQSIFSRSKTAAIVEKVLTIRLILSHLALLTTFVHIYQRKMEFLKSSPIVNL